MANMAVSFQKINIFVVKHRKYDQHRPGMFDYQQFWDDVLLLVMLAFPLCICSLCVCDNVFI